MAEDNQTLPPQEQPEPGKEGLMNPRPEYRGEDYKAAGKLEGKVAIITGGDSGIGRSVAVLYAREGADVAILYLDQHQDAEETRTVVEQYGRRCLTFAGDVADREVCRKVIDETLAAFGKLDILVNNAAEQHPQEKLEDISEEQWEKTFRTNIFGMFQMTKAALPHLGKGASIINTTSVTAYKGSPQLLDYLFGHQGRNHGLHPFAIDEPRRARHSCQRRRARADLDTIDSVDLRCRRGRRIRLQHTDEAPRPAR